MGTSALIDADYWLYRVGHAKAGDSVGAAIEYMDELIGDVLEKCPVDYPVFYLSDLRENNFRMKIDPLYKANRKAEKPEHYTALKEHMLDVWCAEIAEGMEADDALSLNNINNDIHRSIMVSIDKDLLQVPGRHYNPQRGVFLEVSETAALCNFYTSLLVGDSTDNIKGAAGIGKVKAARLLSGVSREEDMLAVCRSCYGDESSLKRNAGLLWLLSNDRKCLALEGPPSAP